MTTDDHTHQPLRLPASYADAPTALISELLESIERDSVAYSKKWFNGNRRAVELVAPILDRVGIASLDGLSEADALATCAGPSPRPNSPGNSVRLHRPLNISHPSRSAAPPSA